MIRKFSMLMAISLITTSLSFAQNKSVEDAVTALTKLMTTPDSVELDKIILNKLSYGHSSGRVQNKQEFMHALLSGESDFVEIVLTDQTVVVQNKTALVRHTLSATTNDRNVAGTVKLYILLIWSKEKDGWKLIGRQAVKAS